jgi:hypothetical protein
VRLVVKIIERRCTMLGLYTPPATTLAGDRGAGAEGDQERQNPARPRSIEGRVAAVARARGSRQAEPKGTSKVPSGYECCGKPVQHQCFGFTVRLLASPPRTPLSHKTVSIPQMVSPGGSFLERELGAGRRTSTPDNLVNGHRVPVVWDEQARPCFLCPACGRRHKHLYLDELACRICHHLDYACRMCTGGCLAFTASGDSGVGSASTRDRSHHYPSAHAIASASIGSLIRSGPPLTSTGSSSPLFTTAWEGSFDLRFDHREPPGPDLGVCWRVQRFDFSLSLPIIPKLA